MNQNYVLIRMEKKFKEIYYLLILKFLNSVFDGASVISSKLMMNIIISPCSFLTGATSILAKNLLPAKRREIHKK